MSTDSPQNATKESRTPNQRCPRMGTRLGRGECCRYKKQSEDRQRATAGEEEAVAEAAKEPPQILPNCKMPCKFPEKTRIIFACHFKMK